MSVLEWKNFNLYKLQPVADYQKLKEIKDKITSQCNNDDNIIFCDAHGWVHVYFNNWDCMSFQADRHPIKLCGITSSTSNILVTLTQDDLTNNVCVQIFSIVAKNKCAAFLGFGRLTAVMSAATALQASKIGNQLCIAIGFLRGDVYIFRGNINRDISSSFKTMFVCTRSITGFSFNHTDNLTLCMFVCSNSGIYCFTINESNIINETKSVLDSCIEGTHSFDMRSNCDDDAYFTVARDKAIYCFTNDGRGPCYVLDGEKPFVKWIGHNLLVVIDQKVSTFPITTTKIIMIDIKNKLIVLNKEFERMQNIIIQKSNCYLITKSMHVFLLRERIIENKIRMLTKKNLFDVAISQIESTGCNQKSLAEVSLQYGDYLSQKGEMTKATEMYIKTIGSIEPYHIIKKLLDSRNTKCLLRYLQVLLQEHREQLSRHHFELLKSCKERINLPTMLETQYFNDVCNQNAETPNINDSINKDESWRNKEQHNEFLESFSEDEEISQVIVGNQMDRLKPLNAVSVVTLLHNLQKSRHQPIKASSLLAILLTRSNNYIELLEQMLTNVFVDFSEQILTNLFERFLNSWKLSKEPSEQRILEFLKIYESRLNTENVIILCKLHSYWKGLLYFIERMGHSTLSTIYLTKNTNIHSVLENVTKWESVNANIWLPVLQKSKLSIEESTNLLYTMISKKTSSLLQMLQSFSCNKSIRVQHIKDCLQQELLQNVFGINELSNHIETLRYEFLDCKLALENYGIKPIEFRNSTCDKCRQELSFPSVFFLCQHAFHKDCIRFYTERVICVICCSSTQTLNLADERYCQSPSSILYFKGSCFNDSISEISKYLANGSLDQVLPDNEKMASQILIQKAKPHHILNSNDVKSNAADVKNKIGHTDSKVAKEEFISSTFISIPHINSNPFEAEETNPFEKYDDNLNPFRE